MKKAEKKHLDLVASIGCILCFAPAEIHHLTGAGMGLKSSNYDVIPLCPPHHRIGGWGVAVHAGTKEFEKNFGTQKELLEKTRQLIEEEKALRL